MKNLQLKALAVLSLLSAGSTALGYSWPIVNVSKEVLVIRETLYTAPTQFYNLVKPGERADFSWNFGNARAGFCLESITVAILSKEQQQEIVNAMVTWLNKRGYGARANEIRSQKLVKIDQNLIDEFVRNTDDFKTMAQRYPLREPEIKYVNTAEYNAYAEKIDKAINDLSSGLGQMTEQALNAADLKASGLGESFGKVGGSFRTMMENSRCTSRNFDYISKKGGGVGYLVAKRQG